MCQAFGTGHGLSLRKPGAATLVAQHATPLAAHLLVLQVQRVPVGNIADLRTIEVS